MTNLREQIAAIQHDIWAHWMKYQLSVCAQNADGSVTIPVHKVERWTRQMNTPYSDLAETERESDRHQADKVLAEISTLQIELWNLKSYCLSVVRYPDRAIKEDGEVLGYWQTKEWIEGLLELALDDEDEPGILAAGALADAGLYKKPEEDDRFWDGNSPIEGQIQDLWLQLSTERRKQLLDQFKLMLGEGAIGLSFDDANLIGEEDER